jgi:hypothetical protein
MKFTQPKWFLAPFDSGHRHSRKGFYTRKGTYMKASTPANNFEVTPEEALEELDLFLEKVEKESNSTLKELFEECDRIMSNPIYQE